MGRGRAKAKQTKVARQLKYSTGGLDAEKLQAELARGGGLAAQHSADGNAEMAAELGRDEDPDHTLDDPYAGYAGDDADEDEHESA